MQQTVEYSAIAACAVLWHIAVGDPLWELPMRLLFVASIIIFAKAALKWLAH